MNKNAECLRVSTDVEVLISAAGAEDLLSLETNRTVIPETVRIRFHRHITPDEGSSREWVSVSVYGPRRLKSGEPGREISSFGWECATQHGNPGAAVRPEWLTRLLADHLAEGWSPSLLGLETGGTL